MNLQMAEVGEAVDFVSEPPANRRHLLVRQLEELLQQAKLVHQFERGRMDGVAAEVAQEIGVFFQHDDIDAGARKQQAQHHAGRTAPNNTACRLNHGCQQSGRRSLVR
jgi:hypothetical protein